MVPASGRKFNYKEKRTNIRSLSELRYSHMSSTLGTTRKVCLFLYEKFLVLNAELKNRSFGHDDVRGPTWPNSPEWSLAELFGERIAVGLCYDHRQYHEMASSARPQLSGSLSISSVVKKPSHSQSRERHGERPLSMLCSHSEEQQGRWSAHGVTLSTRLVLLDRN